jgi:hydroxyacylglutathione hydrolase
MPLQLEIFTLGQMQNNSCVLFDTESLDAFVIDPSFQSQPLIDYINSHSLKVNTILVTHAHFDHFAGVAYIQQSISPRPKIALNPKDLALWHEGGGSKHFNILIQIPENPDLILSHGQLLELGNEVIEVREAPGHSCGSVLFYIPSIKKLISGDVIFHEGIGLTWLMEIFTLCLPAFANKSSHCPMKRPLFPGMGQPQRLVMRSNTIRSSVR